MAELRPEGGASSNSRTARVIQQALALIHAGLLPQAQDLCRKVLETEPKNFNALQLLGQILLQDGDYAAAVDWLGAAHAVNAASASVCSNLAVALLAVHRPHDALQCCEQAVALNPRYPEALCNRGNALSALHLAQEALASYEAALELKPGFADALVGRSNALLVLNRHEDALSCGESLLQADPRNVEAWGLRGALLLRLKRPEEALSAFDRALQLSPGSSEALNNRGTALRDLKRPAEALAAYDLALRQRPEFAEALCNVANIGLDTGRYEEAVNYCDRALRARPGFLEALNIRGTALRVLKRYEEAASTYEKILEVEPLFGQSRSYLLSARAHVCNWFQRAEQASSIMDRVASGISASAPHAFLWISDCAAAQLQCARLYSAEQFPAAPPLWRGERYRHRRVRVAYLSADFHNHPVAHLIVGVLERHDRSRFEITGVSLHGDAAPGPMHHRITRAFEHFWDASTLTDRETAQLLRDAEIDILVDLTGHTRGGRLRVLAFRPAPVQINFLGYTGTSGAPYVDYLIADAVAVPPEKERFYSERIIRMPHCFLPNDDSQEVAQQSPGRKTLSLPEPGFVFCAFNNSYKINPDMFDIWMRLLDKTPGSVLWLRSADGAIPANLRREATARGVDPERLVFAARTESMDEHLARYRCADLFLDTLPYGGHATARDALWSGLPVLTCAGDAFASRVAASLLMSLELPELVASSLEEYAARALLLAHSPLVLANLRAKLAQRREAGTTFDTDLYRRQLESIYSTIGT